MKLMAWWDKLVRRAPDPASRSAGADEAQPEEQYWVQANRVLDALFLEYGVQTRDRRLYAQSMMTLMGFIVAGFAALSGAWAQSGNPAPLVLIAPLMFAGAEGVLLLRVHLLRVSVYLTLVEADIRTWLRVKRLPVAWETSMTGRIAATTELSSPARSGPGLSILLILLAGVAGALMFVVLGVLALDSARTSSLTDWLPGQRGQQEVAYVLLNLFLMLLIAATWVRQPKVLTDAYKHFQRIRAEEVVPEVDRQESLPDL